MNISIIGGTNISIIYDNANIGINIKNTINSTRNKEDKKGSNKIMPIAPIMLIISAILLALLVVIRIILIMTAAKLPLALLLAFPPLSIYSGLNYFNPTLLHLFSFTIEPIKVDWSSDKVR